MYPCTYCVCFGVCMNTCMYMVCTRVRMYVRVSSYVWLCGYNISNSFVRSELVIGDPDRFRFVPVTDLIRRRFEDQCTDDPEIRTSLCSEDQTAIRF